jgi:integrase
MVTDVLIDYARERGPEIIAAARVGYAGRRLSAWWAGKTVAQVTKATCNQYSKSRGASDGTLRRELGVLATAINYAHGCGRLTRRVMVYRPDKPEPKHRWLTRSEVARLLWATRAQRMPRTRPGPYRPIYLQLFILVGVYTGRRKEAILSLRWPQIDLVRGMIDFRRENEAETKKKRGKIPINKKLLGHLRRARKRGADLGFVIADRSGTKIGDVQQGFWGAVQRAGLGADVTPHTLKHTSATWMKLAGVPIEQAADFFLTSVAMLQSVYQGTDDAYMRAAAEAL